ncbi:MAG: metallophosphoesterase [Bacteroidetes bacterium]|nr:MAG: metallophosphoesterase [Bacteroidota bacterium]
MIFRILFTLGFVLAIDLYAYQAFKTVFRSTATPWIYWGITVAYIVLSVSISLLMSSGKVDYKYLGILMGASILLAVPKLVAIIPLLIEDITRLGQFLFRAATTQPTTLPGRRTFVSQIALGLAAIPFIGIIDGIWKGRYRYRVISHTLEFEDLPDEFDGFTIAQISDIHSGSFDNQEKVEYGVQMVNELGADAIMFTGDMVNNIATEAEPWIDTFKKLSGKNGVFSILGNHDYGDYWRFPSAQAKVDNLNRLKEIHAEMGMDLLLNESRFFERNGQRLYLAGVENWGLPPFPQYGDLQEALNGIPEDAFTVLLSHDPSHFDAEVKQHSKKVHLTLSGHTHGMQFGIEIPGWIKWSPVKFKYPKWAGLYPEPDGQVLHVNRGFGFLAFPGRVGMWPEITHITLRKKLA